MITIVAKNSLRCWFRGKSTCCTSEQNQVSVPLSVREVLSSPSLNSYREYEYNFDELKTVLSKEYSGYTQQSESIVSFKDSEVSLGTGDVSGNHTFSTNDATKGIDLNDWLSRPLRISTFTWAESDAVGFRTNFYPWTTYMNNQQVKNKLNNYSWFRGDLKLRFQITASPFYYGMMKVIYRPLLNIRGDTCPPDGANKNFINLSQLPSIDLLPGKTDAYEMTVPFLYHKNYVNLQSITDINNLGTLEYYIYSALDSANGATGTGVTITTYAWLENVELSGASCGYALQSDEYGDGCVSKPASWIANAASYFEGIPVIGAFATATRIGAGAVSSIARLFGFTNVPVIADTQPFRPEMFPKLATSEIGFPVEKLSFDPKAELSVDPRIVGLNSGIDEMNLAHISGRESYLTTVNWSSADGSDTMLFYSRVNPFMYDITATVNPSVFMTPMCMVSRAFLDWRGTIIFRFQIIASKYHKGKLIINFDPSGTNTYNPGVLPTTSNVIYTTIVDLGETNDVEFEIPYQQASQFLNVRNSFIGNKNYATRTTYPGTHIYDANYDNGLITMRVLNALTAPIAAADIDILVYVRAGKDIEYNNPGPIYDNLGVNTLSFYAPQSDSLSEEVQSDTNVLAPTASVPDKQYLVHYGENIRNLRVLLRRYNCLSNECIDTPAVNQYGDITKNIYRMPVSPGYITTATTSANRIASVGVYNYNFCNMTTLSWFSNAFLCYRGSTHWTFNTDTNIKIGNFLAVRAPYLNDPVTVTSNIATAVNTKSISQYLYAQNIAGTAGMALTNTTNQPGLNVANVNYSRYKFAYCNPSFANQGSTIDASSQGELIVKAYYAPFSTGASRSYGTISTYVAAGTDFGLYVFLNVPTVYVLVTPVTYA